MFIHQKQPIHLQRNLHILILLQRLHTHPAWFVYVCSVAVVTNIISNRGCVRSFISHCIKLLYLIRRKCIHKLCLAHSCFDSYATELVLIIYSAIKHGYWCFISELMYCFLFSTIILFIFTFSHRNFFIFSIFI